MKMRSAVIHLLVVLITPITAPPVWAEPRQAAVGVSSTLAAKFAPGDLVRVRLRSGARVDGRVTEVTTDVLRVNPTTRLPVPIRDLALADIDSIDLRHDGWSPGKKVLIRGGMPAAIAGAVLVLVFVVGGCCGN